MSPSKKKKKKLKQYQNNVKAKVVCSHCILIPQGPTGSSTFLVSNESPYISHYNPKISASN